MLLYTCCCRRFVYTVLRFYKTATVLSNTSALLTFHQFLHALGMKSANPMVLRTNLIPSTAKYLHSDADDFSHIKSDRTLFRWIYSILNSRDESIYLQSFKFTKVHSSSEFGTKMSTMILYLF